MFNWGIFDINYQKSLLWKACYPSTYMYLDVQHIISRGTMIYDIQWYIFPLIILKVSRTLRDTCMSCFTLKIQNIIPYVPIYNVYTCLLLCCLITMIKDMRRVNQIHVFFFMCKCLKILSFYSVFLSWFLILI